MIRLSRLSDYGIVLMAHLAGLDRDDPHSAREIATAARIGGATTQLWTEAALLAAGGLVIVLAFLRMRLIRRRIETADPVDDQAPLADALLLLLVAALMALIAAFGFHVS